MTLGLAFLVLSTLQTALAIVVLRDATAIAAVGAAIVSQATGLAAVIWGNVKSKNGVKA